MRIGIYSPYMDTVGGGERYMLTIAEGLSKENKVDIFLDTHLQSLDIKPITDKISNLLNIDLAKINFLNAPFGSGTNFINRGAFLKKYDLIFYLTDGSIFYSTAKKNILHIQSPINIPHTSLWKKVKLSTWNLIIYNSNFTRQHCEKYWPVKGEVVYPPVSTDIFKPAKKKKQILTVGRFFSYLKDKKHELMIESFKKIIDSKKISGWSLHLAGGAGEGDMEYIEFLKKISEGYPVHIHPNLEFNKLVELYGESEIYWHAAGFGETDPAKMEHFGITTVEAMSSGCVPVVINLGGQKEIVDDAKNGFLWNTPDEMEAMTLKLINDREQLKELSLNAIEKSKNFSRDRFITQIHDIVEKYEFS